MVASRLVQLVLRHAAQANPRGAPNLTCQVVRLSIYMAPAWGCRVPHGTRSRCLGWWPSLLPISVPGVVSVASAHSGVNSPSHTYTAHASRVASPAASPRRRRRQRALCADGISPRCCLVTGPGAPQPDRLAVHLRGVRRKGEAKRGTRFADSSPASGGPRLPPPLGRTRGTVATRPLQSSLYAGGARSTRGPATWAPAVLRYI